VVLQPPYSPDIYSVGLLLFLKWKLQFKMTRTEINTGNIRKHTTAVNSHFLKITCEMLVKMEMLMGSL